MTPDDTSPDSKRIRAFETAAELLTAPNALIHLTLEEARVVVGYMTPQFIPANTTFIREGDAADEGFMALLLEGEVVVESVTVSRTEPLTIRVLGAGSLVGEVGLVDEEPRSASVTTSAGALVEGLQALGAKRVSIIAPYMKPLTRLVIDYLEHEGIEVVDSISLEIPNNLEVGARDPKAPAELYKQLNIKGVDAIVASACVQMPSLAAVPMIEQASGLPVVSSAVCTTWALLKNLGLERNVPNAGTLLSGKY